MHIQYLLLSQDGENKIFERETFENELEIPASEGGVDNSTGRHVAVNKHYCNGKYYAVALERHAASNEIDDLIELMHLNPIG